MLFLGSVVKAYQYTSLTSVMLLDCWTIPSVIFLTWMFLKTQYRSKKLFGVAVCAAGLVMVVFSDVHASDHGGNWKFSWFLHLFRHLHLQVIFAYIMVWDCLIAFHHHCGLSVTFLACHIWSNNIAKMAKFNLSYMGGYSICLLCHFILVFWQTMVVILQYMLYDYHYMTLLCKSCNKSLLGSPTFYIA